jgi:hypothetical protein
MLGGESHRDLCRKLLASKGLRNRSTSKSDRKMHHWAKALVHVMKLSTGRQKFIAN